MYRAVCFDLDGTLWDYDLSAFIALKETLQQYLIQGDFQSIYQTYHRINLALWARLEAGDMDSETLRVERFRELFDGFRWPAMDFHAISRDYLSRLATRTDLIPDADELVRMVSKHYRIGALTNGIAAVQRGRLQRCSFGGLFQAVIISEEYGISKPHPDIFFIAAKALEIVPSQVLYVGDSISSDMAGAAAAGMDFCWFNPDQFSPPPEFPVKYSIPNLKTLHCILDPAKSITRALSSHSSSGGP